MTRGQRFLEELNHTVLLGDGAIGTELLARGAAPEQGIERLNLLAPDLVLELHRSYVAAGSRVIETNTFGANRQNLARYDAESDVRNVILAGVRLARRASAGDTYVAGSVGPLPMVDGEPVGQSDQAVCFAEQISALLDGGVDLLIFESFSNLDDLHLALTVGRSITDLPIVAQMSFGADGYTADGDDAAEVARRCRDAGADIVGANCGYGVPSIMAAIRRMSPLSIPLSAYMNAGFPEQVEGRLVYLSSPEYLAGRACDLVKLGVRLIGGCCGTGPDTIRAIAQALPCHEPTCPAAKIREAAPRQPAPRPEIPEPLPITSCRILVELDPPTNLEIDPILEAAKALSEAGADAVTVADNPLASARVDNLTMASLIQREAGIPVIPHLTGRDRNRIALQSTIMGAHVMGIRSLLCVTGDPVRMCQEPNTSGVFDVTSISLVRLVAEFNAGRRMSQGAQTAFSIGVAVNPNVRGLSGQISKLGRKVEAGAQFALSQPIFSEERLDMLQESLAAEGIDIPIFVGVLPLVSARNAEFLHNEVPGILVPDEIRERLAKYEDASDQRAAGLEIATDFIRRTCSRVHGFYLITPRNRVEMILPLISAVASGRTSAR